MTDEEIVKRLREHNHTPYVMDTEVAAYRLGWEARGKEITQNAKRWRILEHGCRFVRFDPIDGDGYSFDPRTLTGYDGDLNHMRAFADRIIERHLAILHAAIARAGK